MGLFSKKYKSSGSSNKYANHPEVLEQMAARVARCALAQLRDDLKPGDEGTTWITHGGWCISVDNQPERTSYRGHYTSYGIKYNDFGMEDVPYGEEALFLKAFAPYLDAQIKALVGKYFPGGYGSASYTLYEQEHYRDTDTEMVPAIEVSVPAATKHKPAEPTYKSW